MPCDDCPGGKDWEDAARQAEAEVRRLTVERDALRDLARRHEQGDIGDAGFTSRVMKLLKAEDPATDPNGLTGHEAIDRTYEVRP